jgi:hypothetical protein
MESQGGASLNWTRRQLLKSGIQSGALALAAASRALAFPRWQAAESYFGVHPFIEANPKAVFIRRTQVPEKMDSAAKRAEGLQLAREIFVPMDSTGIPVSHRVIQWIGGEAVPRKLTDFPRTPLKTYYLQRDGEPLYHLVDEPFDYDNVTV